MVKGNYYGLSEHLLMDQATRGVLASLGVPERNLKRFYGSTEVINAKPIYCLWFEDEPTDQILGLADLRSRIEAGVVTRRGSKDAQANGMVRRPHQFREINRRRNYHARDTRRVV